MTPHFTMYEAIRSKTAYAMGISNAPDSTDQIRIQCTAVDMEHVRRLLGDHPIFVTSWYRSEEVNRAVGGVSNSAHLTGYAVDFHCPGYGSTLEVAKTIAGSCLQFDQLIHEYDTWVHISFDPALRRQLLTKRSSGGPYIPGIS